MLSGNPAAAIFLFGLICLLIAVGSTYTTEGKRVWGTKGYRVRVVRRYLYCLSGFLLILLNSCPGSRRATYIAQRSVAELWWVALGRSRLHVGGYPRGGF